MNTRIGNDKYGSFLLSQYNRAKLVAEHSDENPKDQRSNSPGEVELQLNDRTTLTASISADRAVVRKTVENYMPAKPAVDGNGMDLREIVKKNYTFFDEGKGSDEILVRIDGTKDLGNYAPLHIDLPVNVFFVNKETGRVSNRCTPEDWAKTELQERIADNEKAVRSNRNFSTGGKIVTALSIAGLGATTFLTGGTSLAVGLATMCLEGTVGGWGAVELGKAGVKDAQMYIAKDQKRLQLLEKAQDYMA